MQAAQDGSVIVLRLEPGEPVIDSIKRAAGLFKVKSAYIAAGIGMIEDFEIGFFDGKKYHNHSEKTPHELVTMQGSVTTAGDVVVHLHVSVAGKDHALMGGHLQRGNACVVNEIFIVRLDKVELNRALQSATGLKVLNIVGC